MNQRAGKMHAATMRDEGGGNITLKQLIEVIRGCQTALEEIGEEDSALRFEIFKDYLENEVTNGKPLNYTNKLIGL